MIQFTDFNEAKMPVNQLKRGIIHTLQDEIDELVPEELNVAIQHRREVELQANTRGAYMKLLADDLDALLPFVPEGEKGKWLWETISRAMHVEGEDYNQMRLDLLNAIPQLYNVRKTPFQEDVEILNFFLSEEIVGRKVIAFIRARALPPEEQTVFFLKKEIAQQRLESGLERFCQSEDLDGAELAEAFAPLYTLIEKSEEVDRVLFDYNIERITATLFIGEPEKQKRLQTALMYSPPSDFEINDIIRMNVEEVCSVLSEEGF